MSRLSTGKATSTDWPSSVRPRWTPHEPSHRAGSAVSRCLTPRAGARRSGSTSICPSRRSGGSLRRWAHCLFLGTSSGLGRLFRYERCDCGRAARVDVCNQSREQGRLQSTSSSSTSGQHMADADGQHTADLTCNDGPLDTVAEPTPTDEIAPVVAPPAQPGHAAGRLEGSLLETEEERLRAEVTRLRAEAAASRGLLEERQQQAIPRANAGRCGRGTRGI